MQPYRINDEVTVFPLNNQLSNTLKLEPRLMKLLNLLVSNAGNVVSREEIVEKIWNGYGGGDDGLTQAISFLRKVLNDNDKKIIETVSKTGYVFRGKIDLVPAADMLPLNAAGKGYISYKTAGFAAAALLVIFALVFYIFLLNRETTPQPDTRMPAPGSIAPKAK